MFAKWNDSKLRNANDYQTQTSFTITFFFVTNSNSINNRCMSTHYVLNILQLYVLIPQNMLRIVEKLIRIRIKLIFFIIKNFLWKFCIQILDFQIPHPHFRNKKIIVFFRFLCPLLRLKNPYFRCGFRCSAFQPIRKSAERHPHLRDNHMKSIFHWIFLNFIIFVCDVLLVF